MRLPHPSTAPGSVRIAIIDGHPIFRDALKSNFKTVAGFEIVAEGGGAADAARVVRDLAPDVLLLDYPLRDRDAIETIKEIAARNTRVIVLTAAMPAAQMIAAIQSGARGVVFKHAPT